MDSRARNRLVRAVPAGDTSWSIAYQLLVVVVMTLSFTLLGRRLGPDGYGAFIGMYGMIGPAISFQSGISLAVYEHIRGDLEDHNSVARSSSTLVVAFGAVLSVVLIGLTPILVPAMPFKTAVLFIVGELLINSALAVATAMVMAVHTFASAARWRIVSQLGRGFILVALALADELTLVSLGIAQAAWFGVVGIAIVRRLRQTHGIHFKFGEVPRRHVNSTFLYGIGIASVGVQNDGDKVALNTSGREDEAGLYGAAYRLIAVAQVPITALSSATHLRVLDAGKRDNQVTIARRLSAVAGGYALLTMAALFILAPIVPEILGSEFDGTTKMLRWLTPVVLLRGTTTFPANGLMGLGHNNLRTRILVVGAVVSSALYALLIPPYGWRGAVLATVIGDSGVLAVAWISLICLQRSALANLASARLGDRERIRR